MKPGHGRVDYLLYIDKAVVGVIEAKPQGTPLSGLGWQSAMYAYCAPQFGQATARRMSGARAPRKAVDGSSLVDHTFGCQPA